ncbi:hypothetical protein ABFT80_22150 [Mesorhizobium sp. SB112]|uniref:hypothetical protein n=1 Tax=Mesorhizobium sp. SB112 TaxID=3151853 RepID=UPI003266F00B
MPLKTPAGPPPFYRADALATMDRFPEGLSLSAKWLLETHLALPREVRFVADLQRWLITQVVIAMHYEHKLDPAFPPISHSNLVRNLATTGIASRNTIYALLLEMKRYQIITPLQSSDKRQQAMQATEKSEGLIRHYFDIHLKSLDGIDDGNRYILSCEIPNCCITPNRVSHGFYSPTPNGISRLPILATSSAPIQEAASCTTSSPVS